MWTDNNAEGEPLYVGQAEHPLPGSTFPMVCMLLELVSKIAKRVSF